MSLLTRLFSRENPNIVMQPLYEAIIGEGRRPGWYENGGVPDSLDGRFDMIAAIFSLVLLRLEKDSDTEQQTAWLTEHFVRDMDGQLRQIGIGDMVVGKHVGKMMGALGGRLGAYRDAFAGRQQLEEVLTRNLYRDEAPGAEELAFTIAGLRQFHDQLATRQINSVLAGDIPEALPA
ncbi:cytochrome b pre-mRNA-processing protein 3 [Parasphingorhabdus marina DSM 22363]|uniref:Cytochrome b pre-mRNA-processing protein 3 n=1 Tax=Parasphingorhabdus marina DSM 22363 TaxID=1123272 RepID=A0A1N6DF04_9SPHN|nr:ubiquinol-cytochrome C chaperone family protein [Parasphingorhabdus marina]SIN69214.1 cytochrome b pre-mRNA-processing protein 3 [Parasphingorhabdus marina DSM 22363]